MVQVPEFTAVHPEIRNWSEGVQGPSSYISLLISSVPCRPEDLEVVPTSQDTKWAGIMWAKIKNMEEK